MSFEPPVSAILALTGGFCSINTNPKKARCTLVLFFIIVLGLSISLRGQRNSTAGTRTALVEDDLGPVSGVRLHQRGKGYLTATDRQGRFQLPDGMQDHSGLVLAKEGYFNRYFPGAALVGRLKLRRWPAEDNHSYSWIEPGPHPSGKSNCANCHQDIYREWQGSAHARSASNRRFLNLQNGTDWHGKKNAGWNLRADNPDGVGVCTACHAPTVTPLEPAFSDLRQASGVSKRGVHCDFCHKIVAAQVDPRGLTFGVYGYRLLRPKKGLISFGPLEDAIRPGEDFGFLSVYRDSRYCASCHEGVLFGVPVYTTYSEWLASPAGRQGIHCQSCHMKPTGTMSNIAPGSGGIERPAETLAAHHFPGGEARMLRRCLSLAMRIRHGKNEIETEVRVIARQVGHRVPTGFVDRHLILAVEALDQGGKYLTPTRGPKLPGLAGRQLAGQAGKLYGKLLTDRQRQHPIPFWRFHGKLTDTRLFPDEADRVIFIFPKQVRLIRVRLIYRRFWQEVALQKNWPGNDIVVANRVWRIGK